MVVRAFLPGFKYPSISITGSYCSLMCDFCRARYLRGMRKVSTPKELYDTVRFLVKSGINGVLISGGFNEAGYLPIEPYLPTIRDIKRDFGILISVHAGLVDRSLAGKLRDAGVDVVDYEVVLDDYVIEGLMHLRGRGAEDFARSYRVLVEHGPPYVVPHIPIGINRGRIVKEVEAVDLAVEYRPEVMVFLIFVPTERTPVEGAEPPGDDDVLRVLNHARRVFGGEIALGCMRPLQKKYSLDFRVCELGLVDRIVNPLRALTTRYKLEISEVCCSIPNELLDALAPKKTRSHRIV